ncbi:bis(5'-nucleosyl)-tetraphosphatase (symmetrical) YqeK [Brevibacillus dissolubilis]|uniref:bis(5'-nucleosyl)-tetraphosphatase (symmetrical) YqeK n=1 Tax=Brevibacillus dissolubilis TaxID=1844116 RepID=UPI0011170592|nr:bis(5'-nucleosyl)-tetraphosphatase (symmetrical) YqeK [Brevibacillus dissolubilis]
MSILHDRERLLAQIRAQMFEKRYIHTLGVAESARILAQRFGADLDKAEMAGLLHDYCKCWEIDRQRQVLIRHDYPAELLEADKELYHAFAGAIVVQQELGMEDPEILQAIRYHTTGRVDMTLLEKVVCLADYIEPNRAFPGVEELRQLAEQDLDKALAQALGGTIHLLIGQRKQVYPLTLLAYNDIIKKLGGVTW